MTPERVMEIARECGFGDDDIYSGRILAFASRIREEALKEEADKPACLAASHVYAIYDSDFEGPTLHQLWASKEVAERVAAIWNAYEATNPHPNPSDYLDEHQVQALGLWAENHPCGRMFGYTAPFVVSELTVYASPTLPLIEKKP